MRFKVIPPTRRIPYENAETLILMQDNWDDYGFLTSYSVHVVTNKSSTRIGAVKILRSGQTDAEGSQIKNDFDSLNKHFVSVGQELDYYQHLNELGLDKRQFILTALRDVVALPALKPDFESEQGWGTSLFRGQTPQAIDGYLKMASAILGGNYTAFASDGLQFSLSLPNWDAAVSFDFSDVETDSFWDPSPLPERVMVLIGRNGSGKSTLLARLARIAHSSATHRIDGHLDKLGTINPVGIGFPRIITISYSAFDGFALPGLAPLDDDSPDEREQIVRDSQTGTGRYIFCGLRDIASELQREIDQNHSVDSKPLALSDRASETLLKPISELGEELNRAVYASAKEGRIDHLVEALSILFVDSAFAGVSARALVDLPPEARTRLFLSWSTGQKIAAQIVANLTAYTLPMSLVLIDEPEMHLHPPLLARLMQVIRHLLGKYKAFAIIATHSPVVLQESLARHILVVRREGESFRVSPPGIETFGENVGTITAEAFGLDTDVTDFHSVLDALMFRYKTLENIERLFKPRGLSLQSRAYIMSRLSPTD